jgi:hypothetical protein
MPAINLLDGPDANTYEIVVFVAMIESILVSALGLFGTVMVVLAAGTWPTSGREIGVPFALLSAIGLIVAFRQNRTRRPQIAALTLLCALVIPCWALISTATLNLTVVALAAPGVLLSLLSILKLIQLRTSSR